MPDSIPPQPPSRPRPSTAGIGTKVGGGSFDTVARVQTLGALVLGILLFAVPLYLWRRPRSTQAALRSDAALFDAAHDAAPPPVAVVDAGVPAPVKLADARVLECHDKGTKHTAADQCDHLPAFEKAFDDAILASHECVPADAGAGSIEYVADLSFVRKRNAITVALPRDGRSFQSAKVVKDCASGVRARLLALPLGPLPHAHARYKVAVVASYLGPHPS